MTKEKVAIRLEAGSFAVAHEGELGPLGQTGAQQARQGCPSARIAAAHADHQEPRDGTLTELIDQQLLLAGRADRQKEGNIGREARIGDDENADEHRQQPEQQSAATDVH
jgi:hypothetical protein